MVKQGRRAKRAMAAEDTEADNFGGDTMTVGLASSQREVVSHFCFEPRQFTFRSIIFFASFFF